MKSVKFKDYIEVGSLRLLPIFRTIKKKVVNQIKLRKKELTNFTFVISYLGKHHCTSTQDLAGVSKRGQSHKICIRLVGIIW